MWECLSYIIGFLKILNKLRVAHSNYAQKELNEIKPQTISEMASKYMNLDQEVVVA